MSGLQALPSGDTCQHVYKWSIKMPKMKTKSGAKKRFTISASGRIKRSQAFKRHILTKKDTKTKRQLRGMIEVHAADKAMVRTMMPYA